MKAIRNRDSFGRFLPGTKINVAERFWAKVKKTDNCWLWIGGKNTYGYGYFKVSGRLISAHRFVYELIYGLIPKGKLVLHKCDNPPCVKPSHLFLGTYADNTADMFRKDRQPNINYVAEQKKGAKAKKEKTMKITLPKVINGIRILINQGIKPTQRTCRSISGYNSIQRYFAQAELIAMAEKGD